ncbi:hypothetical protein ThrDRAFT_00048 [Frankia casuarinae]|nr:MULTISPECIES: hypothetical protein [Frankia]ETA02803.1 hypothetical protein CcI6DRAFT_01763 [Frankia sp. CcI6]KFB06760.1 hypothetical protein ALLO2DRAFT_00046 [Frankia sp. Allo2]EYT94124.1 hypothetical protein ThrDRAFT_00048 [Frankia casuarinae]KDA44314.1 hypothetical protein BMG523Draft_00813 [Frankia sp. BMG5.23]OAA31667.1 hypothetical protein AAY23_10014 [Frankia casuarinae]
MGEAFGQVHVAAAVLGAHRRSIYREHAPYPARPPCRAVWGGVEGRQ